MARTRIVGTSGKDKLVEKRVGESDIFGLGGNDTILLNRSDDQGGNNTVDAGPGNDRVVNSFEGKNVIKLGKGNDTYIGAGFTSFNEFDIVRGGPGKDKFIVATKQSRYFGDAGNDIFISEGFSNTFNGGSGTDTIDYSKRSNSNVVGDIPVTVNLLEQRALTSATRAETLISIENVIGTRLNDIITGNNGKNVIKGINGDDSLVGLGGNDTIDGGPGSDFIAGDGGNDRLTGGSGRDGFLFRVAPGTANADVITDFTTADDIIGLSSAIYQLPLGPIDPSRLVIGKNATNPFHRVIYDKITGKVFFDSDGSGPAQAQLIVTVTPNTTINAANIEGF